MSLKDLIARDTHMVFLNANEFCDNLVLQIRDRRIPIVGSLQQESIQNNSGNGSVLQKIAYTLYISYPIDLLEQNNNTGIVLSTGTHITIDDKSFTVVDLSNEMGIATIHLTTQAGR